GTEAAGAVDAGVPETGAPGAAGLGEVAAGAGAFTLSRMPLLPGLKIDSARQVTMNTPARTVVALVSTLAEPRGPKAVWVPPPPKALARSWLLPCWRSTTPIRKRQAMMWTATTA